MVIGEIIWSRNTAFSETPPFPRDDVSTLMTRCVFCRLAVTPRALVMRVQTVEARLSDWGSTDRGDPWKHRVTEVDSHAWESHYSVVTRTLSLSS